MQYIYRLLIVCLIFLLSQEPLWSQLVDAQGTSLPAMSRTKDDQLRQIQIDKAKLEMELAKKLMQKKKTSLRT